MPVHRDPLRADDGIRTRDPHLGKVMLYQLSHVRAPRGREPLPSGGDATSHLSRAGNRRPTWSTAEPLTTVADMAQTVEAQAAEEQTAQAQTAASALRIWIDGQLYDDPEQARVSAVDHGLVVGDGVFEALKVTPAGAFATQRHLDRLTRSARSLGLPDPDHNLVRAAIDAVLEGRPYAEGKIRITYTGGRGPLGSQAAFGPTTLVVAADVAPMPDPITDIVTAPWTRNERGALAGVKSTSYAENVRGLAYATERGASEAIFVNTRGQLCEGTGTNIFCVFGSEVITPPLSSGPLAGITREVLLEWYEITEPISPSKRRRRPTRCLSPLRSATSRPSAGGTTSSSPPRARSRRRSPRCSRSDRRPTPTRRHGLR